MTRRYAALINGAGLVIGAAALYWVLTQISLGQLIEALRLAHLGWIWFVIRVVVGGSTLGGLGMLIAAVKLGAARRRALIERLPLLRVSLRDRATGVMENFIDGLGSLGSPLTLAGFYIATAAIWLTEIMIAWC